MSARFPFQSVRAGHRTNQNKGITMKSQGLIIAGACALMIAGCTNNPYTGEQQAGKSADIVEKGVVAFLPVVDFTNRLWTAAAERSSG